MNGFVARRRLKSGAVTQYKRYRCGAKFVEYHGGACLSEKVVEEYLVTHVEEQVRNALLDLEQKRRQAMNHPDRSAGIRAELDRLNSMYQKGRIKEAYYDEQYALLSKKLEECRPAADIDSSLAVYQALSDAFAEGWQEIYYGLDAGHKKAYWKEIIASIEVDPQTRKVCGFQFRQ